MSEYKDGFEVGLLAGKSFERERIITLLDTECECDHDLRCSYHRMISLIKGENK